MKLPFIDLAAQQALIRPQLEAALSRVMEHGQYVLGPEVGTFEQNLGHYEGGAHVQACANGTDAIILSLLALGIGRGDAVFCPSFTYAATAEAVAVTQATPVFVDVNRDTYCMDTASLETAIRETVNVGRSPRAVIAVDLFGQPADYPALKTVTGEYGLKLISDCAQGLGCRLEGKSPLTWADVMTTSFFPSKPLGCYGDGGAVLTHDRNLYERLNSLHFHGRGSRPFDHEHIGMNSRLDSFQAAVLLEKLKLFDDEIRVRNRIADRYSEHFSRHGVRTPHIIGNGLSTWAQYTIEVEDRDNVMIRVQARDIPCAAYYPLPTHLQTAYRDYPRSPDGLPHTEAAMHRVMALPMHAYLSEVDQDLVIRAVLGSL
ncbi:MAG: DegT/DnrJ/EryC1/StrS family aminotransferase [Hyphomonadaceae bacterium]|nr:DegT/DnrJ/EryC1/StrS family aminotransferase [Hyphomonadaceae bacterium]